MKIKLNFLLTAMMLFLLSLHAMGHQPHRWRSDLAMEGEANIAGETAVFCLKASNDSAHNKLSGYTFSFEFLDDYEPMIRPHME